MFVRRGQFRRKIIGQEPATDIVSMGGGVEIKTKNKPTLFLTVLKF